jgi:hypothetical protein
MEESGSEGLDELINSRVGAGEFFDGVDCVCISDNYWLNDRTVRGFNVPIFERMTDIGLLSLALHTAW